MICLIRTMNPVTFSFAQAVLKDAGIESFLFDMNASVLDGSTILVQKRLMIIDDDQAEARELLEAAGIGNEMMPPSPPQSDEPKNTFLSNLLRKLTGKPK